MNRRDAQELLPWFVAGTLSEEETRAVQAFIDSGEIPASEVDELAKFAEIVSQSGADEPAYNPQLLQNVMSQLDGIAQESPEAPDIVRKAAPAQSKGLFSRIGDAISWQQTPMFSKLAMGAQFAALLALTLVIATPGEEAVNASYQTVSGTAPTPRADLTIAFADGVSEQLLRDLLFGLDASITAGPSSLGMYDITLPESADIAAVQQILQASPLTTLVEPTARP